VEKVTNGGGISKKNRIDNKNWKFNKGKKRKTQKINDRKSEEKTVMQR